MLHGESSAWPRRLPSLLFALLLAFPTIAQAASPPGPPPWEVAASLADGGLCVQLGTGPSERPSEDAVRFSAELANTGRFLVQVLEPDDRKATATRERLERQGLYGLVSVDRLDPETGLPYADNTVNLLVIMQRKDTLPDKLAAEITRVLRPGGVLFGPEAASILKAGGLDGAEPIRQGSARKPWPARMDGWPQPRHAADGNAVSSDTLVGSPRGVRWVAGPFREIGRMISSGGRNYYGDVWARDAFNGLLLWTKGLNPAAPGSPAYQYAPGNAPPIAAGNRLFVVSQGEVLGLDGSTGAVARRYDEAGKPQELLESAGLLLAVDTQSIRAVEVDSGKLRWTYSAAAPRCVVADEKSVCLVEGSPQRGEKVSATCLDLGDGKVRWKRDDDAWAALVRRIVCHGELVAMEVSTLNNDEDGNAIHMLSAADGKLLWSRTYAPGMNHMKQARAMFVGDALWVLERGKVIRLDAGTGEEKGDCPAGFCHCFPPVATSRFLLAGEMNLTDLAGGSMDANRITKAACSRDFGWVPANGLIYVTTKHCVCWPMLRGFVAMAPELPKGVDPNKPLTPADFLLERGPAMSLDRLARPLAAGARPAQVPGLNDRSVAAQESGEAAPLPSSADWPMYRHDAWRSSCTAAEVPTDLAVAWTADLGAWPNPDSPIVEDWRENPFVHGPVTAPVIADGVVYLARPDAQQVVALDAATGKPRWRFTANGRVDTAPTIHAGLCLFGAKSGWVYCLRASDGQLVWRLRAAPAETRMVAYGQLESPWPVPGSVLVVDNVAYFAAGRQPLADGGILVFAVEPASGKIRWVHRLASVPMDNFYACCALEFDNFDLMQREGKDVGMSRWMFARSTGEMTCKAAEAFARLRPGGGPNGVVVPRQCWTYAPRNQPRNGKGRPPERPLVVFRDGTLLGCLQDQRTVYRRDFDAKDVEAFDTSWITGWAASKNFRDHKGEVWRSDRLDHDTRWSVPVFGDAEPDQRIAAMVLAGDTLFLAGLDGRLTSLAAADGRVLSQTELSPVLWDGMAAAEGRLFVSTADGKVVCLGKKR